MDKENIHPNEINFEVEEKIVQRKGKKKKKKL